MDRQPEQMAAQDALAAGSKSLVKAIECVNCAEHHRQQAIRHMRKGLPIVLAGIFSIKSVAADDIKTRSEITARAVEGVCKLTGFGNKDFDINRLISSAGDIGRELA